MNRCYQLIINMSMKIFAVHNRKGPPQYGPVSSGYEKRKLKPSYYWIQVSDLENVRDLRLADVFDASPCSCELGFRVYGKTIIAEELNFANLEVRPSRV